MSRLAGAKATASARDIWPASSMTRTSKTALRARDHLRPDPRPVDRPTTLAWRRPGAQSPGLPSSPELLGRPAGRSACRALASGRDEPRSDGVAARWTLSRTLPITLWLLAVDPDPLPGRTRATIMRAPVQVLPVPAAPGSRGRRPASPRASRTAASSGFVPSRSGRGPSPGEPGDAAEQQRSGREEVRAVAATRRGSVRPCAATHSPMRSRLSAWLAGRDDRPFGTSARQGVPAPRAALELDLGRSFVDAADLAGGAPVTGSTRRSPCRPVLLGREP